MPDGLEISARPIRADVASALMTNATEPLPEPAEPPVNRVKLDDGDMCELMDHLEAIREQGEALTRPRVGKARRRSEDPLERIEWQLDQIRAHTLIVAGFFVLALIGALLSILSSS